MALLGLMLVALAAAPPAAPAPAPTTPVEGVVVKARPPRVAEDPAMEVQGFIAAPPRESIAKWGDPVCPVSVGLPNGQDAHLAAAISEVARGVGAPVAKAGCRPNLVVFVTDDPDGVAKAMLANHPDMFGDARQRDVEAALERASPVRWWSGTEVKNYTGQPLPREIDLSTGTVRTRTDHARNSLIATSTRTDMARVIVLVDAAKVDGLPLSSLAAHIAMGSLVQVRAADQFASFDTVMNLFADRAAGRPGARGLTIWDTAFLKSLYAADLTRAAKAQRWAVGRGLDRNLSAASPPSTAGGASPPGP